jgi:hypothetical protein
VRASSPQRLENALKHSFRLLQYFIIPEPQHAKTRARQIQRPLEIFRYTLRVLATVKFDHETRAHAGEVHNVASQRHLAPESVATEVTIANEPPKTPFGIA